MTVYFSICKLYYSILVLCICIVLLVEKVKRLVLNFVEDVIKCKLAHSFIKLCYANLINKVSSPRYWIVLLRTPLQSHSGNRSQSQSIVEGKSFYSHGSRWDNADATQFDKVPTANQLSNNY